MPSRRRIPVLLLAATLAGCAHAGTSSPTVRAPVALEQLPYEDFRPPADCSVEVMVASLGRPDASTLRITGTATSETRAAVERWVGYARFTPARQGDHTVAARYRTRGRTEVRAERRP